MPEIQQRLPSARYVINIMCQVDEKVPHKDTLKYFFSNLLLTIMADIVFERV